MMEAFLYYNYFATQKPSLFQQRWWYRWLNRINLFFMVVELFLFYTVTFVSSKEHMGESILSHAKPPTKVVMVVNYMQSVRIMILSWLPLQTCTFTRG